MLIRWISLLAVLIILGVGCNKKSDPTQNAALVGKLETKGGKSSMPSPPPIEKVD